MDSGSALRVEKTTLKPVIKKTYVLDTNVLLHDPTAVTAFKQRSLTPFLGARQLLIDGSVEIHNVPAPAEVTAVLRVDYRTSARRQHHVVHLREVIDGGRLAFAKPLFTLFFEDKGNIDPGPGLHLIVAIDERQVQGSREVPAHGGLTRPHGANKKDISGLFHSAILGPLNRKPTRRVGFLEHSGVASLVDAGAFLKNARRYKDQ